ncbi:SDR family oxidoreductase [Jiulongibacter sp. NS-SX5]|uniref:SDR family oxidoreductase n=1 Tax=Jiulongibacter sp. NS-SX5 TaxID=3463854 RepID=UPI004058321B
MMRILVAGATGYLGRFMIKELQEKGYTIRVLIRSKNQIKLFEKSVEVFIGDITKPESIKGVCESVDWVFSSVGITRQKDGLTYMDVDFQGNANLLNEAIQAKAKRFQYISAINGDKLRELKIFQAKEAFVDLLKQSSIEHSIIRPNGFFSDMKDFLEMAKSGRIYLFGKGDLKLNPIHGEDLARFCREQLEKGTKEVSIGGPEIFTQKELGELALKVLGKPIKITFLPDWTRKAVIWLSRTFTSSKTYGPIEFFLTAMSIDNIAPPYGRNKLNDFFMETIRSNSK